MKSLDTVRIEGDAIGGVAGEVVGGVAFNVGGEENEDMRGVSGGGEVGAGGALSTSSNTSGGCIL